jgi:iturin family lipopeptide synthetase C
MVDRSVLLIQPLNIDNMPLDSKLDPNALEANKSIKSRMYWQQRLSDFELVEYLHDVTVWSSPAEQKTLEEYAATAPEAISRRLHNIAPSAKARHIVLLSAMGILLHKLSGKPDVAVFSPVYKEEGEYEDRIIPVRMNHFANIGFPGFISIVKDYFLQDLAHGRYPIEKILSKDSQNLRTLVMLTEEVHSQTTCEQANTDLLCSFGTSDGLTLTISYNNHTFGAPYIAQLADRYFNLLGQLMESGDRKLSDIGLLTSNEKRQLLIEFNDTKAVYPSDKTIIDLFEAQVAKTPGNTALTCGDENISYETLHHRKDIIAAYLQELGAGAGALVGIMLERSIHLIPCILGVLKAGCTYVPIDPAYPVERINMIIADAGIKILITKEQQPIPSFQKDIKVADPDRMLHDIPAAKTGQETGTLSPHSLAYVLYTSGSTGKPKGVMITHQSLVNYVCWGAGYYVGGRESTFALHTSVSFDLTVTSIFIPLITGGKVMIYKEDKDLLLMGKILADQEVEVIKLTPSHLSIIRELEGEWTKFTGKRKFIVGGEELPAQLARDIFDKFHRNVEIYNEYGPTEATVGCMIHPFDPAETSLSVPIGVPISNSRTYVLDAFLSPVPTGVEGQLYIAGDGLAKGYLNNDGLTAGKFISAAHLGEQRLYRTGDIAVRNSSGQLLYKGREDDQVKIHGFRIELGEITHQLATHAGVKDAVVVLREGPAADKFLAAYYVAGAEIPVAELKEYLSARLPGYMVPAHYVPIPVIPLTPNGKIDKRALPEPLPVTGKVHLPPQTHEEKLLVAVWEEVLGVKNIGLTDDLFTLGADSLKSIQISLRIQAAGYDVSVRDILACKTIQELSGKITAQGAAANKGGIIGKAALTPNQAVFFRQQQKDPHHFNQSVLLHFKKGISGKTVANIFKKILEQHDALCTVFKDVNGEMMQEHAGGEIPLSLEERNMKSIPDPQQELSIVCSQIQESIDLLQGPLMKLGLFHLQDGSRLFIVIHHLVTDELSWRILLEDFDRLYQQVLKNEELSLPMKTDSFQSWSRYLQEYRKSKAFIKSKIYWDSVVRQPAAFMKRDKEGIHHLVKESDTRSFSLDSTTTARMLTEVYHSFSTEINEILLTALLISLHEHSGGEVIKIDLAGHGRIPVKRDINISRTVGWFSGAYPVVLPWSEHGLSATIAGVKQELKKASNNGFDYLIYKYHHHDRFADSAERARIGFMYQEPFLPDLTGKTYGISTEVTGADISPNHNRDYDWIILAKVTDGQLHVHLTYSTSQYEAQTIHDFLQLYKQSLNSVIDHCITSNNPA